MYFLCYFIFLYLHSEILGVFVFEFSGSQGLRVFDLEVFVFETPEFSRHIIVSRSLGRVSTY